MSWSNESLALDEQTLQAAVMYANSGESIEDICAYINPKYRGWNSGKRKAYEATVRAAIEGRQRGQSGAARMTIDSAPAYDLPVEGEEVSQVPSPPALDVPKPSATGLTRGQILIVIAIFALAVAVFTTLLRRIG